MTPAGDHCGEQDEEVFLRRMLLRLTTQDRRLVTALARRSAPFWMDRGFRVITHAGGAAATIGASLALMLHPATRGAGLVAGTANLLSHLAVQALKRTVVRPRPSLAVPGVTALAHLPDHFSFPSGHSAAAMAVAVGVLLASPAAGLAALAVAVLVGMSRVYLRVHYATDVLVGQALGAAAAVLAQLSLA